jgi:hypothetical protein
VLSVFLIVFALSPFRRPPWWVWSTLGLYIYGAASLAITAVFHGSLNDSLYFNTLLQLPLLIALAGTRRQFDYPSCVRFVVGVLVVQLMGDAVLRLAGISLWQSYAFVGGVGNPSSFALLCAIGMAFCIFYPEGVRWRWPLAVLLGLGALQTKAMFGAFAIALILLVWAGSSWRRASIGVFFCAIAATSALALIQGEVGKRERGFLEHKLTAAAAFAGLAEYDVGSSASVSQRVEMHQRTIAEIFDEPSRLLWGHLGGLPYWPMDSELLTYLGSFGLPFVTALMMTQVYFTWCAWRTRKVDGGFHALALLLFGFIFLTNRVLDYYPIVMIYFVIVTGSMRQRYVLSRTSNDLISS